MTLKEWKNDFKGFINELSMLKDDYNRIMEYIDEVPNETKWIPCSESLPEEGEEALISGYDTYNKKVIISRYQGKQYGFTCGLVSAWMPLPKPYNAESE